jgi:tRNA threonylcarbamoyladenosine biosynthesis protein TsaB
VLPVSNLQAIASFGTGPLRAAFFDARRGEVYGAVYDAGGAVAQAEIVAPFPEWLRGLPAGVEFVTPAPAIFAAALPAEARFTESPRAIAAAVARIAAREYEAGNARDAVSIDANYVRRSDAELFWKDSPLR